MIFADRPPRPPVVTDVVRPAPERAVEARGGPAGGQKPPRCQGPQMAKLIPADDWTLT